MLRYFIGVVLLGHGLVHLTIYPGADSADGGRLSWGGDARFASDFAATETIGHVLILVTVALYVVAGLAMFIHRLLPLAGYLTAAGSILSIVLFWWMWPGLEPQPEDFWRGPLISAAFLLLSPLLYFAGRDASAFAGSRFSRGYFATWGTTTEERAATYPCDAVMPDANTQLWRGIDVDAPAATVYNWLGMVRVAPYSYDLLDNKGRRSPREIDESLPPLGAGQKILGLFKVVEAEPERGFTATSDRPPPTVVTYRIEDSGSGKTRLVVKLAARCESELGAMSLGFFDLLMMRKQLRTLARLSQRSADRGPVE